MSRALDGLSAAGREAATHGDGPLLLHGGPGSGLSRALVARVAWLAERGEAPESVLVLAPERGSARRLRASLEAELPGPYEELFVLTPTELGAHLLASEAPAASLDPFGVRAGAADRLALMLEHAAELELRFHDTEGRPAALLQGVVERIDRLKGELVEVDAFAAWAATLPRDDATRAARADREAEFGELYRLHEQLLAEAGVLDDGGVLLRCRALLADPAARARITGRFRHVLVDEVPDLSYGELDLVCGLAAEHRRLWAGGDPDSAIDRLRGATHKNFEDLRQRFGPLRELRLDRSLRCPSRILCASRSVVEPVSVSPPVAPAREGGDVRFWRCASERAQAQAVAAEIERLVSQEGLAPEECCVLVRSARQEGAAIALALEERALPHSVIGAAAFFQRAEVRDVLAWLRLLVDPNDAGAAVRALARAPIELRAADLARCTQIARRRKLDMVSALVAATESPQLPPEARERILRFLKLFRSAAAALDTTRPDLFIHRLIERLGLRRQQLFTAQASVVERLVNLARLGELAAAHVRRQPQATPREFARYVAAVSEAGLDQDGAGEDEGAGAHGVRVMSMSAARGREFRCVVVCGLHAARMPGARGRALEPLPDALLPEALAPETRETHVAAMRRLCHLALSRSSERLVLSYAERSPSGALQPPSPFAEAARTALEAEWEPREEELFGPAEGLQAAYGALRDELWGTVGRVGGRLGELRFDTDLDIGHAIVRYLELLKVSALLHRPPGQQVQEALPEINLRLAQAVTGQQREILESSPLDERLLHAEQDERRRAQVAAAAAEPSLEPFLPRRGDGLLLSASDIDTYRTCPLRYKFARVFRIPQEPTANQRFGILIHQVLERFHGQGDGGRSGTLAGMLGLLDAGWRRSGFGSAPEERRLRAKATAALSRYHERFETESAEPVWFERSFAFRLGGHWLRGRVDRVDRLPDGGYELIDYKTGRPRSAAQLRDDVQLSLYAVGAQEAWDLDAASQSYYYILDDEKVPVPRDAGDRSWIEETVAEVAEGILGQGFEPTPSYAACSACDYRIACPAAER